MPPLRQASDDDEKRLCVRMVMLLRLAVTANKSLDHVFNELGRETGIASVKVSGPMKDVREAL